MSCHTVLTRVQNAPVVTPTCCIGKVGLIVPGSRTPALSDSPGPVLRYLSTPCPPKSWVLGRVQKARDWLHRTGLPCYLGRLTTALRGRGEPHWGREVKLYTQEPGVMTQALIKQYSKAMKLRLAWAIQQSKF